MTRPLAASCSFTTERLDVAEWHLQADRGALDPIQAVQTVMTSATTMALPPEWQGDFDETRAAAFVEERDAESPTLLVSRRKVGVAVGLVFLFEEHDPAVDIRLGYVLAEECWGQGLATELLNGLVGWARQQPEVAHLTGGVENNHVASKRVLEKAGFEVIETNAQVTTYRWSR